MVEPLRPEPGFETLTVTVLQDERLLLDLGMSPRPSASIDVVASFFTPDALLRVSGVLVAEADGIYELVVKDIERVQRRATDRVDVTLTASVVVLDASGPMMSVIGHTKMCRRAAAASAPTSRCRLGAMRWCRSTSPTRTLQWSRKPPYSESYTPTPSGTTG